MDITLCRSNFPRFWFDTVDFIIYSFNWYHYPLLFLGSLGWCGGRRNCIWTWSGGPHCQKITRTIASQESQTSKITLSFKVWPQKLLIFNYSILWQYLIKRSDTNISNTENCIVQLQIYCVLLNQTRVT